MILFMFAVLFYTNEKKKSIKQYISFSKFIKKYIKPFAFYL